MAGGGARSALIDSGVELLLQQQWHSLLAGIPTRAVTERAGVTTGSFFHHFRDRAHFAEALAEHFQVRWGEGVRRLLDDIESLAVGGGPAGVRAAADADWDAIGSDVLGSGLQHLLWVARAQPLHGSTTTTAGQVLGDAYLQLTSAVVPAYERALVALGREMLPPFRVLDLAVALTAVGDGLQMRAAVDPGGVRPALYPDLVAAVVVGVTRPRGERVEVAELAAVEHAEFVVRPAAAGVGGGATGAGESWRQIARAAEPLFVGREVGDVRVAEIADAAGVSTSTVYHQFAAVSAVAAATWARHVPELEAIAAEPLTVRSGPDIRLEQVLTRYAEIGRANRGALEGLVLETIAEAGPGGGASRPRSIAATVPLPSLLMPHIRELRTRGKLRRRIDSHSLARSMLQLVSMRVLMAVDEPVERIIDETLGLLLEGALVAERTR